MSDLPQHRRGLIMGAAGGDLHTWPLLRCRRVRATGAMGSSLARANVRCRSSSRVMRSACAMALSRQHVADVSRQMSLLAA